MDRWTMEELNSTDDISFAVAILNERGVRLSPYSPLGLKLKEAAHTLATIKEERDRFMLRIAQRGLDAVTAELEAPPEEEPDDGAECRDIHGNGAEV